jgi:hypothetical protein
VSGWAKAGEALGALFSRTPIEETDAYRGRVAENVGLEQKMAAARREKARAMALESVLNDESIPLTQRNLLAAELGTQFAGLNQGLLREQERGLRDEAFTRADAAGYGVNAPLMALARGPVAVNKALSGGRLQGNEYLAGADFSTTDIGEADLARLFAATAANNARATASNAQARASNARAELYGRQADDPAAFRAQPRAAPAGAVYSTREVLEMHDYNRRAQRPNSGLTPIANIPKPGDPKPGIAAAPAASAIPASTAARTARNPQTGEVLELRNGQWVKVQ